MTKKAKSKRAASRRRLPGRVLDAMLRELAQKIDSHIQDLEAIEGANQPNGWHVVIEHRVRTIYAMMLDVQLRRVRDIAKLAHMAANIEPPSARG